MSALDDVRNRLTEFYTSTALDAIGVHAVTFQPLRSHPNEDRMVMEEWDIEGDKWLFLAVCDGHGGAATSEFTANTLPARIRNALCQLTQIEFGGLLDRDNVDDGEKVSSMLRKEILSFDRDIGKAVKKICRKPGDLTEEHAKSLIQQHPEALQRALCGTTLAAAIVNISRQFMWAVGVGDSTVALCTNTDGKHNCQRLTDMHTPKNPQEYFRVAMAHPAAEKDVLFADRVIGFISITRTLGDFTLKFHRTFLTHLFRFMSATFGDIEGFSERIFTPPYLIAEPSVKYIDLQPIWKDNLGLMVFSDGVDSLVDGYFVFRPETHSGADPCKVVAALLQENIEPYVEGILGHPVEPRWNGPNGNRAIAVLGNLLGGTDVRRLEMTMDQERLADDEDDSVLFHIDDTSIILCDISQVHNSQH